MPLNPSPTTADRETQTSRLTLRPVTCPTERQRVLAFIRNGFSRHFGVTANIDPPSLLIFPEANGDIAGAVGLRSFTDGWFSAQYLNAPTDAFLEKAVGRGVEPESVVEVVHLTVRGAAMMSPLLDQLALYLEAAGYQYTLCTVTQCLRRLFQRRGWSVTPLAEARPSALGDGAPAWGRYYDEHPMVILGDLKAASCIAAARQSRGTHR